MKEDPPVLDPHHQSSESSSHPTAPLFRRHTRHQVSRTLLSDSHDDLPPQSFQAGQECPAYFFPPPHSTIADHPAEIPSMDEPPATPPKQTMGWGCWIFGIVIVVGLAAVASPMMGVVSERANQMKASNNCRQIIMSMKVYASDHNGAYPTGATANEAFRKLIQEEILPDERIFGSPVSRYMPDGNIGFRPEYASALMPGELHWMLVDDMNEKSPGAQALVFENSLDTTWPPRWDPKKKGSAVRGRTWKGPGLIFWDHQIVIGRNDVSVSVEPVDPKTGHLESQFQPGSPFPIPQGDLKLLDIEE